MRNQHILFLAILLVFSGALFAQNNEVQISPKGGVYADAFPVTISCSNSSLQIRYTLNGANPDKNSALYSAPFMLSNSLKSRSDIYKIHISPDDEFYLPDSVTKGIVIRAAAFDNAGNRVSPTVTQSYFITSLGCEIHGLPVVSICADSLSLFAHDTGILVPGVFLDPENPEWTGNYYEEGRDWERRCNVEYYAIGNEGFNQQAGLRTHGGNARRNQQKGLKIYAREEYGKKRFKYKIFDDLNINNFKRLVFKPFKTAWTEAGLQNYLSYFMAKELNLDVLATRPVVLFLNGEYWGIYFIQEKPDERYLENHYYIDPDSPDIISSWLGFFEEGDNTNFNELMAFVRSADLSDENEYRHLSELIDIDNFIDYQILEIFASNYDWPANNMRCWQAEGYPWRWFFFDCDACFGNSSYDFYEQATDVSDDVWPSNATSTLLFRSLLKNETFNQKFIDRLKSLIHNNLAYKNTKPQLTSAINQLQDEISHQVERFQFPQSFEEWEEQCNLIDAFLRDREETFWQQTCNLFVLNNDSITELTCYPNPVPSGETINITVKSETGNITTIDVYDLNGNYVYCQNIFLQKGGNRLKLNLGNRKGMYIIKVGKETCKVTLL
jgi:hypothetical protein